MARVQVQEFNPAGPLKPAPVQSDTFVAAPPPVRDNRMGQLAEALGAFSGSIGRLGAVVNKKSAEDKQKEIWAEEKKLAGYTREQYAEAVEKGEVPEYEDKFKQKAIKSVFGSEYGAKRAGDLKQDLIKDFDWENGDVDEYITQRVQEDVDKYGEDPNFGRSYVRQMRQLREWAINERERRKVAGFQEAKERAAFGFIDTHVNHGAENGSDPEQIASSIYAEYHNLGKKGTLGMDYKKLDQEVLNKARRIASTHPDIAIALISHERKGDDGQMRSLLTDPNARDTVLQIQAQANKVYTERDEAEQRAGLQDNDRTLFEQGRGDEIEDTTITRRDGKKVTISAEDRMEAAKEAYFKRSEQIAQTRREEPNERLARELRATRLSGEKHPKLEKAVGGMADMASIDMMQDPEAKKKLLGKLETYKWMQNESTNSTIAYTKPADRDFAETYIMAQRYLGQDKDTALSTAIRAQQLTKDGAVKLGRNEFASLQSKVKKLASTPGRFWGTSSVVPANYSVVEQNVTRMAGTFIKLGLKPDKAVKAAAEAVKKHTITYNGVVLDMQGHDLPDNFDESLDANIKDFANRNKLVMERNDLDVDDLSVVPAHSGSVHGGRFMLIDKDTLLPVHDDKGNAVFMTLGGLRKDAKRRQDARDNKAVRDAALKSGLKSRKLSEYTDRNGKKGYVDRKTKEVYEVMFDKDSTKPVFKKTGKRAKLNEMSTFEEEERGDDNPFAPRKVKTKKILPPIE